MKLVDLRCPHCQSAIRIDDSARTAHCAFCDSSFLIDDEVIRVEMSMRGEAGGSYRTDGRRDEAPDWARSPDMRKAGDADSPAGPAMSAASGPKRKTWLWVLGWLLMFPVPLTILMLKSPRTQGIDRRVRIGIVVAVWALYICIGIVNRAANGPAA
ncbi:hypothetical protein HLV38_00215 [Berryella wangjianweii]|uniref:Uncharacterized protein n=1 Tax=Berryella wangjianweii TaxID=2734634 RepID=A0A6M8IVU4_9ACTN|nr:hypothetical protein [Berryella wangjianweii]QKF06715.1 hypothetical protein HLV38_00215 [Berryella wangjianweii]